MRLPELTGFNSYIHQIHQAIFLFGAITHVGIQKQQNWIHIATEPHPWGFQTQAFPNGGRLLLNVLSAEVQIQHGNGDTTIFDLTNHTQKSLFEGILDAMHDKEISGVLDAYEGNTLPEKLLRKIHSNDEKWHKAIAEHTHETPLAYDSVEAADYMQGLTTIYTGIARWRGRLSGHLSPMVVWAEHFDLSTIWFKDAEMDEYKSHINIGFAPFTEGTFERPYLYGYAYPMQDGATASFTVPLKWETEAYTGAYLAYDELRTHDDPIAAVEMFVGQMFEGLQAVLG